MHHLPNLSITSPVKFAPVKFAQKGRIYLVICKSLHTFATREPPSLLTMLKSGVVLFYTPMTINFPKQYNSPEDLAALLSQNIRSNPLKKKIAACYDLPVPVFTSWLTVITLTRNSCCHHARVWNRQYAINPIVARKMKRPWISDAVSPQRTFYEICIIKWFIDIISLHNDMKQHFLSLLEQYPSVDYKAIGIPQDWLNEPLWR